MGHASAIKMAEDAQRLSIEWALSSTIVAGRRIVAKWNDNRFWVAGFSTTDAARRAQITTGSARYQLDKLAEAGEIERIQRRAGDTIHYRLPRSRCDEIAAQVTRDLLADGLEMAKGAAQC